MYVIPCACIAPKLLETFFTPATAVQVYNIHNIFADAGSSGDMVTTIYLDGSELC